MCILDVGQSFGHFVWYFLQVFEDVVNGRALQTIPSSRPHSLLAINIFRETVLAFVQDDAELKVTNLLIS